MRQLLLMLLVTLLVSCSTRSDAPKDLLEPKQMQRVVWEILVADELALQNKLADSSLNLKNESFRLYDQVFAIHKISRTQYYNSYRYYQQHPVLYKNLMEEVKRIGEKERKAAQASVR
jgi:hypothetical protein